MSTTHSVVLGKRKCSETPLVLNIQSSSEADSDSTDQPIPAKQQVRRFSCNYQGCDKSYTKPSRLKEHERSHTGERPYKCTQCSKSYLRETHLQAHTRVHLPSSSRQFACEEDGCDKRFWTAQHLRVHMQSHRGEKTFHCKHSGCIEAFSKNHQLRAHVAAVHSSLGTKAYPCPVEECTKSFSTSQKLKAHSKVHDEARYTCLHPTCQEQFPTGIFFSNWTALQRHNAETHPPMCPYPECNGRTFSASKNLKAHLKVHENKEAEALLQQQDADAGRPTKRRRGGEVGRDWECTEKGCDKTFKSKKALKTHNHITHLKRRDFLCRVDGCTMTFGYKHLMRRHIERDHPDSDLEGQDDGDEPSTSASESEADVDQSSDEDDVRTPSGPQWTIDFITGVDYATAAKSRDFKCPWPSVGGDVARSANKCDYAFSRAYDLRRHMKATHGYDSSGPELERYIKSINTA